MAHLRRPSPPSRPAAILAGLLAVAAPAPIAAGAAAAPGELAPPPALPRAPAEGELVHVVEGDAPGDWFGFAVAALGDVDGDGVPDFAVGAHQNENWGKRPAPDAEPGYVRVYSGADARELYTLRSSGSASIDGTDDHFGHSMTSIADLDGDGVRELVVGAYLYDAGDDDPESVDENTGGVFVFSGATGALLHVAGGAEWGDRFGYSLATLPDRDGDGREDLLVGVEKADWAIGNQGSVEVRSTATFERLLRVDGPAENAHLGCSVAPVGDLDADGVADFVAGAFMYSRRNPDGEGRVELFSGAEGRRLVAWTGDARMDHLGYCVTGVDDVDGDGLDDVAAGARQSDWVGGFSGPGLVRVFSTRDGALLRERWGAADGDQLGWTLARSSDRDGDGRGDLLAGAPAAVSVNRERMTDRPGRVVLFAGPDGRAARVVEGLEPNDQFGASLAELGDLDGDGLAEVLVGAPENVIGQSRPGYAAVLSGRLFAVDPAAELARDFAAVLAELHRAEQGGAPVAAARLDWLHHAALWRWVRGDAADDVGGSWMQLVLRIHGAGVLQGIEREPWIARAARAARDLRARGDLDGARRLVVASRAARPGSTERQLLVLEGLDLGRSGGRWDESVALLEDLGSRLADGAAGAEGPPDEARARWLLQAADLALALASPGRAGELLEQAERVASALPERRARRRALVDVFVARLALARARGTPEDLRAALARAQGVLGYAGPAGRDGSNLTPDQRAAVLLEYALGAAEVERRAGGGEGSALPLLDAVLATHDLAPERERRARMGRAAVLLDRGGGPSLDRELAAIAPLARAATSVLGAEATTDAQLELFALRARAARAGADRAQRLERLEVVFARLLERSRVGDATAPPSPARDDALAALVDLCLAVDGPERGAARALGWVLRAESLRPLARRLDAPEATLARVQRALVPADGGLLVLLPGEDGAHAFAVERRRVTHLRLAPTHAIDRAALRLAAALRATGDDADDAALERERERLARLLLPPDVCARLRDWRAVTFAGSAGRVPVPFELLALDASGAPLGERLGVGRLPSVPVGLALARDARGPRTPRGARLALVGDVGALGGEAVPRFTAVGLEGTQGWSGDAATLDRVEAVAAGADRGTLVQLLGAPGERAVRRGPERLELPSGERLDALFAAGVAWPPVVALTTAGPWTGAFRTGDDALASLPGAVLGGGARAVLLSDLGPGDAAARAVLEETWRGLVRAGLSPAEALRRARARLRASGHDPRAVLRTGLYQVVGAAHDAPFRRPFPRALAVVALVGVLAVGAGLASRRAPA